MLHVAQISFFSDPQKRTPRELLQAWPTIVDVAEAAASAGVQTTVVQASTHVSQFERGAVSYHFLDMAAGDALLRGLGADVFHVHGLDSPRHVEGLAGSMPEVPIILQDHASGIPRFWRRPAIRRGLRVASGIAFCASDQALPFIQAGLIESSSRVYEIPESTSRFTCGDRDEARRITGMRGSPALLWVGHLDTNKDPLTVLRGVSHAARTLPDLSLYCCFGCAPLLRDVEKAIQKDPWLRNRVRLLGRISHERIELLMRAADLFVLGSHREGSGYSVIEALACGLPPVVTDIPSFRSLTGRGRVGKLWPCDDALALCEALCSMSAQIGPSTRAGVRRHFERCLSFEALGGKLAAMYRDVIGRAADNV